MSIKEDYNAWAATYDANRNKTRDLEAQALRNVLQSRFQRALEAGCGTGKNTSWLAAQCDEVVAVDFSANMLSVAKNRTNRDNVNFRELDLLAPWPFSEGEFDLVVCSLVLEHIEDLDDVFQKVSHVLKSGGIFYIGELHPFKQYSGSKARFGSAEDERILTCHKHHVSSFFNAAARAGLSYERLDEHFHEDDKDLPRVLTLLFRK
jgi:Methylase involved in ubiquinone/menaquinone biosynthesis